MPCPWEGRAPPPTRCDNFYCAKKPVFAREVEHCFGSLTLLFPKHLAVEVIEDESAESKVHIEGTPAETTNGTVRLKLDKYFSTLNIRYAD